jgi:hypothetical protein
MVEAAQLGAERVQEAEALRAAHTLEQPDASVPILVVADRATLALPVDHHACSLVEGAGVTAVRGVCQVVLEREVRHASVAAPTEHFGHVPSGKLVGRVLPPDAREQVAPIPQEAARGAAAAREPFMAGESEQRERVQSHRRLSAP